MLAVIPAGLGDCSSESSCQPAVFFYLIENRVLGWKKALKLHLLAKASYRYETVLVNVKNHSYWYLHGFVETDENVGPHIW